ncbi:uncharacterized protein [Gossypium hirsutum]|uniref:Uncharacterized protein n=1 Tax=Gossypium hirsutum TaxID=3635 RepID=A0ABM3A765_GOSHI|nr:uncharacterized protein LOC121217957 [Gossypium hirsutum]
MDYISGCPQTLTKKNSVWVIVDRWTKSAHFISVRTDYSLQTLADLYIFDIVRLHGVPVSIISDKILVSRLDFGEICMRLKCVLGPELVSETEDKVRLIRDCLKVTSDRQKSYADLRRHEIEYSVGDFVFFKLELPPELDCIHNVFHILMLRRYRSDPTPIVPVEEIEVRPNLTFEEEPVQILDHNVKVL